MEEQSQRGKGRIIEIDHYNLVSDWYFRISYGRYLKNCGLNTKKIISKGNKLPSKRANKAVYSF